MKYFEQILASLLLAIAVPLPAQEPAGTGKPEPEVRRQQLELITLRAWLGEAIHCVQPLASGAPAVAATRNADAGTTHARAVARIRDAVFDAEGALQHLLVDRVTDQADAAAEPLVLAAADVKWDSGRRKLVTTLDAAQIAALPTAAAGDAAKAREKAKAEGHRWIQARELLAARMRTGAGAPVDPPKVIWFAPAFGRLAFATLPATGGARLLPWSIVQPVGSGEQLTLQLLAAKEQIEGAPNVTDEQKPPDAMQRLQSFRHFDVAIPAWEERQVKEAPNGNGQQR
jgi:hypothetical protein